MILKPPSSYLKSEINNDATLNLCTGLWISLQCFLELLLKVNYKYLFGSFVLALAKIYFLHVIALMGFAGTLQLITLPSS